VVDLLSLWYHEGGFLSKGVVQVLASRYSFRAPVNGFSNTYTPLRILVYSLVQSRNIAQAGTEIGPATKRSHEGPTLTWARFVVSY